MQKTRNARPQWIAQSSVIAAVFVSVIAGTGVMIGLFAAIIKVAHLF